MDDSTRVRDDMGGYTLLDFGGGRRLESWAGVRLVRPDPRAVATVALAPGDWDLADAEFVGRVGRGRWAIRGPVPDAWTIHHAGLRFEVRCAPSMHTGLFPEQAAHWHWLSSILPAQPLEVLNLFAYTGGASLALARLGHHVTHVDASRPVIGWAQRNAALNHVDTVRWIQDDARRFVAREVRRRRRYQGLLLDPPAFGRGPHGVWKLGADFSALLDQCLDLLAPAAFVLLNVYTAGADPRDVRRWLGEALARRGLDRTNLEASTLALASADGRELPTGVFARINWPAGPAGG